MRETDADNGEEYDNNDDDLAGEDNDDDHDDEDNDDDLAGEDNDDDHDDEDNDNDLAGDSPKEPAAKDRVGHVQRKNCHCDLAK